MLDIQEGMGLEKMRGIKNYTRLDPSTHYRSLMLSLLTSNPHLLTKTTPSQSHGGIWVEFNIKPFQDILCYQKIISLVYFSIHTDTSLN